MKGQVAGTSFRGQFKESLGRIWTKDSAFSIESIDHHLICSQVGDQQEVLAGIKHHLVSMGGILPALCNPCSLCNHNAGSRSNLPILIHGKCRSMPAAIVGGKDIIT